jgi:NAD(P)-dependent dehydrogenase (short-subunit alcohol dehydrogenase family)
MKTIDLSRGMVFVTGGGGSIGGAIATEAASAGAKVAIADANLAAAQRVADDIVARGGEARAYQVDVTKSDSLRAAMADAASHLGQMIGLVTAAAILRTGSVATQSEDGWREIMAVNVEGTFKAVQAAVKYLSKTKGAVVTLGSVSAYIGSAEGAAYTTTKGAVLSFTFASAGDLAPLGIRVNAVSPGWVDGGFTHQAMSQMDDPQQLVETAKRMHYLGRMATPTDVANAAVWLLSDQAAFVTGTSLLVDGGYMVKRG